MKRILIFLLVLVLVGVTYTAAFAQEETEILPCDPGVVSGTVTSYDEETGVVTLDVGGVLCTVNLTSDYDHPIVALLGAYFSEINTEEITQALDDLQVCVVFDGESYIVSEPLEDGTCAEGELATVTGEAEGGGFEAQTESGEPIVFDVEDEAAAGVLSDALGALNVEFEVDEEGGASDTGDDISELHEDGYGFGVIVKVYAIQEEAQQACAESSSAGEGEVVEEGDGAIDPCDVTVDLLLGELEGKGVGHLFKVYGKPAIMGIGHVRNIGEDDGSGSAGGSDGSKGICNAREHGGNANAKGKPDVTCDTTEGEPSSDVGETEDIEGDG